MTCRSASTVLSAINLLSMLRLDAANILIAHGLCVIIEVSLQALQCNSPESIRVELVVALQGHPSLSGEHHSGVYRLCSRG